MIFSSMVFGHGAPPPYGASTSTISASSIAVILMTATS
jgi:hypothetical protein